MNGRRVSFLPPRPGLRRGLTLMEVLISIGILAIGLSSVVALVPVGRSQQMRAVLYDRAAVLAANALADAATFGLFHRASLTDYATDAFIDPALIRVVSAQPAAGGSTISITISSVFGLRPGMNVRWHGATRDFPVTNVDAAGSIVVVDVSAAPPPLPVAGAPIWFAPPFFSPAVTKDRGIFADEDRVPTVAATKQLLLATQGRDDMTVAAGVGPDDPPRNVFGDGTRSFEGRMTCALCVSDVSGGDARASVIVFSRRDPTTLAITGTMVSGTLTVATAHLESRPLTEIVRPGTVVYVGGPGGAERADLDLKCLDRPGQLRTDLGRLKCVGRWLLAHPRISRR